MKVCWALSWAAALVCVTLVTATAGDLRLVASTPVDGETIPSPERLLLRFDRPPDPRRSYVIFVGGPRSTKMWLLRSEGSSADVLSYRLPSLPPGRYEAQWRAVAADGAVTEGVLNFTVK